MLSISIICVGKLKESYWRDAVAEYSKRLSAFCRFSVVEVDESRLPNSPSNAQINACLVSEGKSILAKIPSGAMVFAMCIEGKQLSSEKLAASLANAAVSGKSAVTFIIGGSHGLSDEVKQRADFRLSMSPMTFPHQLARVMLSEQIYRAMCINADTKYHK